MPPTVPKGTLFSTSSSAFLTFRLPDDSPSNRPEGDMRVISPFGFAIPDVQHSQAVGHLHTFFGTKSVQVLGPIVLHYYYYYYFALESCERIAYF